MCFIGVISCVHTLCIFLCFEDRCRTSILRFFFYNFIQENLYNEPVVTDRLSGDSSALDTADSGGAWFSGSGSHPVGLWACDFHMGVVQWL